MVFVGQDVEAVALTRKNIIRSTPTLPSPSATSKMTTTHVDMGVPNKLGYLFGVPITKSIALGIYTGVLLSAETTR